MKSLLSISLLSVMLSTCGGSGNNSESEAATNEAQPETEIRSETITEITGEPKAEESPTKPENTTQPDTSKKQMIEHGAPDQSRNDSVKAAKTKGKF